MQGHDNMIVLQHGVREMFLIRVLRELREGKKIVFVFNAGWDVQMAT